MPFLYYLNEHRSKNNLPLLFVNCVSQLGNMAYLVIDGKNFLIPFNLEKTEFSDSQINLHPEVNDSVLGLKEGIFGDLGVLIGYSITYLNQLRVVKSSSLLL